MKRAISYLNADDPFPSVDTALEAPNGLLAVGGDLSPARLLAAYQAGVFPWFNEGQPILWWSPDPRMVMFPQEFEPSRSLRKTLKRDDYVVRADTSFRAVMTACAAPRADQDGTWITPDIIAGYCALHERGLAHSIETWMDGELVGGLYGVALGRMFYGESMFARRADASKIAFAHLVAQLKRWNFGLIDCQVYTDHLASLGAREIPRTTFIATLTELIHYPHRAGVWHLDNDLRDLWRDRQ